MKGMTVAGEFTALLGLDPSHKSQVTSHASVLAFTVHLAVRKAGDR